MIPDEIVDRIRERADIVEVIGELVPLRRAGANFKGLCPFHQEKTPSFNVNPSRQMYHCFGCGEGGDVFSFLMRYEGRTFVDAVRDLGRRYGVEVEERTPSPGAVAARKRRQVEQERMLEVMERAARFYSQQVARSDAAHVRDYLRDRGIGDEAIERFGVGYAPAGWDALTSTVKKMDVSPAEAERLGLIVARRGGGGYYDRLRDRVVFPVRDAAGRVVALGGRVLPGAPDDAPKYVNSPESPVFSKGKVLYGLDVARDAMRRGQAPIVVEGYLDVISMHMQGLASAVAPMGTAMTTEQAALLRRFAGRSSNVALFFDGDEAGLQAARRAQPALAEAELGATVALLPPGEDPDSFVRERGADAVREILDRAEGLVEHLIGVAAREAGLDGRSKARAIRGLWPALQAVRDPMERDLYKRKVADAFAVSDEVIFRYLRGDEPGSERSVEPLPRPLGPRERAERTLVGALLDQPMLARDAVGAGAYDLVSDEGLRWIIDRLEALEVHADRAALAKLADDAPDPGLSRRIRARLVKGRFETTEEAHRAVAESLSRLRDLLGKEQARALQSQVNQAQLEGDVDRSAELAQQKLLRKRAAGQGSGGASGP